MSHLYPLVAICGWKHDGRGKGEAPEGRRPPALFDEKERMVVAIINKICIFAITYFTDKSRFFMDNKNKRLAIMILGPLFSSIGCIILLMSGLEDDDKLTIIIACFCLLLNLVMIVESLIDWFRKR